MDWRDYLKFIIIGVVSLLVGGFVSTLLGLSSQSGIVATILIFIIPLSIFYFLLRRFR